MRRKWHERINPLEIVKHRLWQEDTIQKGSHPILSIGTIAPILPNDIKREAELMAQGRKNQFLSSSIRFLYNTVRVALIKLVGMAKGLLISNKLALGVGIVSYLAYQVAKSWVAEKFSTSIENHDFEPEGDPEDDVLFENDAELEANNEQFEQYINAIRTDNRVEERANKERMTRTQNGTKRVRPRSRHYLIRRIRAEIKAEMGMPMLTEANEKTIRYKALRYCEKRNIRYSDVAPLMSEIVDGVFTPYQSELRSLAYRNTWKFRLAQWVIGKRK